MVLYFSQQFRFLTARRRLEKLVLPSIFDTSFILDDMKLTELSNNSFENYYYRVLRAICCQPVDGSLIRFMQA